MKYLYLTLGAILTAVIQVSFLSNLRVYGGMLNLAFLVLAIYFYVSQSPRRGRQTILFAFLLGIFLDLISGSIFLSSTLTLVIIALLLEFVGKLVEIDSRNILVVIPILIGSIIFDLLYLSFNQIFFLHWQVILPMILNSLLTLIGYIIFITIYRYFVRDHRLSEIKLN